MKYRDSIYFHADRALYVNWFIPSTVRWKEQGAVLTQTTTFPESPGTTLKLQLKQPSEFALELRHPEWSKMAVVLINGEEIARSSNRSSYIDVSRTWREVRGRRLLRIQDWKI